VFTTSDLLLILDRQITDEIICPLVANECESLESFILFMTLSLFQFII
jgi:hypothetical protein